MNPSLDATFALHRSRILLRLQVQGWPSLANPFGGKKYKRSSNSASPMQMTPLRPYPRRPSCTCLALIHSEMKRFARADIC